MDSGVATAPIENFPAYVDRLNEFVYHSGLIMKPVFTAAKQAPRRIVYAEGEDERALRAVQVVVDEGLAKPILIGRPEVIERRIERFGLRIRAGNDFECVNPAGDSRYRDYWSEYHRLAERKGVSVQIAKLEMRRRLTLIGAMMIHKGEADGMLCGLVGIPSAHLLYIDQVLGRRAGIGNYYAMNVLILPRHTLFLCDTFVNQDPAPAQLLEMVTLATDEVRRFGLTPKVALVSHSSFGSSDAPSAVKMREALALIRSRLPDLEIEGEMQADAALSEEMRLREFPNSRLKGEANLLVMPNLDAANIGYNLLKVVGGSGITIGPILLGAAKPVHILTPNATVRRIVNMTALAVVSGQSAA
jgi:malate dehydrogenase (oxaloacetate-decarboxylating)(NADP+)